MIIKNIVIVIRVIFTTFVIFFIFTPYLYASGAFLLEVPNNTLIGRPQKYLIKERETLIELAMEFDLGYNEITEANGDVDPWIPEKGSEILIPTSWILPEILNKGILINLAEMRLYHFFNIKNKNYVRTFPIGIGREGFNTPEGTFRIVTIVKDPVWNVPESIRKERPELPAFIPPGPDNPLGKYWLQLSIKGYGIHGTNRPYGIGRRVSHGCIRLYPKDIEILSRLVRPNTMVKIINEPVKATRYNNRVYIEISNTNLPTTELKRLALKKLSEKRLLKDVNTQRLMKAIKSSTGLPTVISD